MDGDEARARFWEKKILLWEKTRYSALAWTNPCAWTVRERMRLASRLLVTEFERCRTVLDLGCGSGYLAHSIIEDAHRAYTGIDFARAAIESARKRFEIYAPRIRFECKNVFESLREEGQLAIFLGLTDWLDDGEITRFFEGLAAKRLLFSFSDAEDTFSGVYRRYRRRVDDSFPARSYRKSEITAAAERGGYCVRSIIRSFRLGPGCLVIADKK